MTEKYHMGEWSFCIATGQHVMGQCAMQQQTTSGYREIVTSIEKEEFMQGVTQSTCSLGLITRMALEACSSSCVYTSSRCARV